MPSAFEESAKQAAVMAAERRWQQQQAVKRRQWWKARMRGCLAFLVLLAGLCGAGLFLARTYHPEVPVSQYTFRGVVNWIRGGQHSSSDEVARRESYMSAVASFGRFPLKLWREAADTEKPQKAAEGTRYLVLVGKDDGVRLFELRSTGKGGVSVMMLSPVADASQEDVSAFREAISGRPYFILRGETVYVCGSKTVDEGKRVLKSLLGDLR